MIHYCTYLDGNYLAQGLALYDSMERHCQPFSLSILALDNDAAQTLDPLNLSSATVVPLHDFLTDELRAATVGRTHRETIWTYTASWMLHVFDIEPAAASVNYIDADCYFFGDPAPVFTEIGDADVAITPHRFPPRAKHFESNGLYNVGLVHVKRSEKGLTCLREWETLCIEKCQESGQPFADQGYWDRLVPNYGVHVIEHLGCDLAPWNQEQYSYAIDNGHLMVNGQPLIMYHFHQGLDPKWPVNDLVKMWAYNRYNKALSC